MTMAKYILKRILIAIPVLFLITVIDFALMCLSGNPLETVSYTHLCPPPRWA